MIAVSRCLIGENCTYAGKNNLCKEIKELYDQGLVLPLCPEVLGGLPIPRTPCEVIGEKVIDQKGIDRTKEYTQGAKIALDKCLEKNIKIAVLKAKLKVQAVEKIIFMMEHFHISLLKVMVFLYRC